MHQKRECILKFSPQYYRFSLFWAFRKIYVHTYKYGACEWGACPASGLCLNSLFSRIFTRGNFSSYVCYISITVPYINLYWMQINRKKSQNRICKIPTLPPPLLFFLVHSGDFCVHEYKFASVKKPFIFPPIPKSLLLESMHNIRGSRASVHDDRFINFIFS